IVWLQRTVLLLPSVASHVRVTLKLHPTPFVVVLTIRTVTLLQLSPADGGSNTGAVGHSISRSLPQEMLGGCRSVTRTVKLHDTDCPAPSVAVQLTVVVPTPN